MKPYTIAITGKGGTGKTTIAAAIVASLIRRGLSPVLAVDADPNSCLDGVLGVQVDKTVGRLREESRGAGTGGPSGISKRDLVELRIAECLVEAKDFDLIAMGRPEGPGCYCYANNLFKDVIGKLTQSYPFIVIDNEAGLENLSRRLYQSIDLLIITGDPSRRGLATIERLYNLAGEMGIAYDALALAINLVRSGYGMEELEALQLKTSARHLLTLPFDADMALAGEQGRSILGVDPSNPVLSRIDGFITRLGLQNP
ncbi:MAG TPA: AAA family ATPase [Deltaproteobacteria bacterium]|nr:AAA family ATPase [Deltaproteobacteria bacterium]